MKYISVSSRIVIPGLSIKVSYKAKTFSPQTVKWRPLPVNDEFGQGKKNHFAF